MNLNDTKKYLKKKRLQRSMETVLQNLFKPDVIAQKGIKDQWKLYFIYLFTLSFESYFYNIFLGGGGSSITQKFLKF